MNRNVYRKERPGCRKLIEKWIAEYDVKLEEAASGKPFIDNRGGSYHLSANLLAQARKMLAEKNGEVNVVDSA